MSCALFRSVSAFRKARPDRSIVVTIGNFDGMHLGHRALFSTLRDLAGKNKSEPVLVTLRPHPRFYFSKMQEKQLKTSDLVITPITEKLLQAEQEGISAVVAPLFSKRIADLAPERFIEREVLGLGRVVAIVVGQDWHFGKNRLGNTDTVRELGKKWDFETVVIPDVKTDGERVSSSSIRTLISEGKVYEASQLLGRWFSLTGHVRRGERRGTTLGFPTANLEFKDILLPTKGVYVTQTIIDGKIYPSATNIGLRPTFFDSRLIVENHILNDFSEDIYGKRIRIEFVERLRDERKFTSVDELKSQIAKDSEVALSLVRELLSS